MKTLTTLIIFLFLNAIAFPQTYVPMDKGSKVHFVIRNFGIKTGGDFSGLKGNIVFNPKSLNTSLFNVTVNSASIDTDNGTRDGHLKKTEYFDVDKYPVISFVSTDITESTSGDHFVVVGKLTIKDITKSIQFDFTATALANGYSFKGAFDIDRRDFGVGGSSISMSDNLTVTLDIFAAKETK